MTMARAQASDNFLSNADAAKVAAMIDRGDRKHDIAAWFGVNPGRVADVEDGQFGALPVANPADLPPSGSPGPKLIRVMMAVRLALEDLKTGNLPSCESRLELAISIYEKND